jgi:competence protein ComEC
VAPTHATHAEKTAVACGGAPLRVHFYNVSQALAVLVDLPDGRHILVDAGEAPDRAGCGEPCKNAHGHLLNQLATDLDGKDIDILWATHQHSDHIGGVPGVLAKFSAKVYVDNGEDVTKAGVKKARAAAAAKKAKLLTVAPQHALPASYSGTDVKLTSIVPGKWPSKCSTNPNICSIGLRIDYCESSLLFVGDAEEGEEAVLDPKGRVTLLQVGHHGSRTSSSKDFLSKTAPKYAVVSAGLPGEGTNKTYCHPAKGTISNLDTTLGDEQGRLLRAFANAKCGGSTDSDWADVPTSLHLWATPRDGDVVLFTAGDGVFTRK